MTTTPTNLQPPNQGSVLQGFPELSAYIAYASGGVSETVYVTWQVASNSGFTTNLQSVTDTTLRSSGQTARGSLVTRLAPGTWYLRARSADQAAVNSSWATTQTFVVAHKAFSSAHSPSAGQRVAYGNGDIEFSWVFADQDPTDTQSAFQVRAFRADTDASLFDTNKVTSTNQFRVQAIALSDQNGYYYWQVRVWDFYDLPSEWSQPIMFQLSQKPTVEITSPTAGGVVTAPNPTFTWAFLSGNAASATYGSVDTAYSTYTALDAAHATYGSILGVSPDQANQAAFKVIVTAGLVVIHDSGWVATDAATYDLPDDLIQQNTLYTVVVWVRDAGLYEGDSAPINFSAAWPGPDAPIEVEVDTSATDTVGAVQVSWNAETYDPSFVQWRAYRRLVDLDSGLPVGLWELVGTSEEQVGRGFVLDYTFEPGALYQYAAVQAAYRYFDDVIESVFNAILATPTSEHYWLICPDDTSLNVRLTGVNGDSFSVEYESAEYRVIGRGRRVEVGTRYGMNGVLSAALRGDIELGLDASEQIRRLEAVKDFRRSLMLRIPFGDLLLVAVGSIQFDRIPGVGMQEFVNVSIPYLEVSA